MALRCCTNRGFSFLLGLLLDDRKINVEGCSFIDFALHFDCSPVALYDAVNHGKAQAGPFSHALVSEIRLKDAVEKFPWYSVPGVADGHPKILPRAQSRRRKTVFSVQLDTGKFDRQDAFGFPHGIGRIGAEVHEDPMKLGKITIHLAQIQLNVLRDLYGCRYGS